MKGLGEGFCLWFVLRASVVDLCRFRPTEAGCRLRVLCQAPSSSWCICEHLVDQAVLVLLCSGFVTVRSDCRSADLPRCLAYIVRRGLLGF